MDLHQLIDDWAQGDPRKQGAAWHVIAAAAQPALRAALPRRARTDDLLDDLEQEFYFYLLRVHDPIPELHGDTWAEFHGYLQRIAHNFVVRFLAHEKKNRRRERAAARAVPLLDHVTISEAEALSKLAEFEAEAGLRPSERETLEVLRAQMLADVLAAGGELPPTPAGVSWHAWKTRIWRLENKFRRWQNCKDG